ncbi:hypothetical protein AUJ17_05500 [Candidatus Micrarchaeota archaeon CG1_02_47_40]|nr:MAG: hypothetical protein AUJ17_05500 [Candidatus Micrarchaeota archaeon CG1_02_47_40]
MRGIFILLVMGVLLLATFGCVQVDTKHDIKTDGTDYTVLKIYKTGLLMAGINCESFKSMARSYSANLTQEQLDKIENMPCRETDSAIFLEGSISLNENDNLKETERNGKTYFRFEEEANPVMETTVKMPSKVISHNGQVVDDYTVIFLRGDVGLFDTGKKIRYVEAEKPSNSCCLPLIIIGFASTFVFLRKN